MEAPSPIQVKNQRKQIILNADDFGPSAFLNAGIIKGVEAGVINSVSVFVTYGKENLENIKALKKLIDDNGYPVKIGLHFTTTAGYPIAPPETVKTLYSKKFYHGKKKFKSPREIKINKYWASHMKIELDAQLELLRETLNLKSIREIDHINNHIALVHFNYSYWKVYSDLADHYDIAIRNPFPFHIIPGSTILTNGKVMPATRDGVKMLGEVVAEGHWKTAKKLFKGTRPKHLRNRRREALKKQVRLPSYFIAHYYKQPSKEKIHHFLEQIKPGDTAEFMFHLADGIRDKSKKYWGIRSDSYQYRKEELKYLLESDIRQRLGKDIDLVNYSTM